jgi:hypothetical protein
MKTSTSTLSFDGQLLRRGFWLYVWEATLPNGSTAHYVGRTGDSSSRFAQSPFNRMRQHLGFAKNSNMLRRHLEDLNVVPEGCVFRFVAHGPILEEADDLTGHRERRDVVAAMEKALAQAMTDAGYLVMNTVNCRVKLDPAQFKKVRAAFASQFEKLAR